MLLNDTLISVIMPVYNVENYVEKALLSICNQTYSNLQIIVIDDCSTDNTYKIVSEIAKLDTRILLLRNEINSKIVKTLNYGLQHAKGDFIARMDGDDISAPKRLEKQLKFLINNPIYSLVGSHIVTIDDSDNILGKQKMPTDWKNIKRSIIYASPVLHIWLAKREVYTKLNGYREIPGAEDYDFLLRMLSMGFYFTNIDGYDYSVRIRDGNTNTTIGFNQRLMSNYVVNLYKLREEGGDDGFSVKNIESYLNSFNGYKENFDRSNEYLRKSIFFKSNKEYIKMIYYLFKSVIISKFQFNYVLKRLLFKIIIR